MVKFDSLQDLQKLNKKLFMLGSDESHTNFVQFNKISTHDK